MFSKYRSFIRSISLIFLFFIAFGSVAFGGKNHYLRYEKNGRTYYLKNDGRWNQRGAPLLRYCVRNEIPSDAMVVWCLDPQTWTHYMQDGNQSEPTFGHYNGFDRPLQAPVGPTQAELAKQKEDEDKARIEAARLIKEVKDREDAKRELDRQVELVSRTHLARTFQLELNLTAARRTTEVNREENVKSRTLLDEYNATQDELYNEENTKVNHFFRFLVHRHYLPRNPLNEIRFSRRYSLKRQRVILCHEEVMNALTATQAHSPTVVYPFLSIALPILEPGGKRSGFSNGSTSILRLDT